jgi:hypothetical protein
MGQYIRQMLAGPGTLRFVVQPIVSVLAGLLHGVRDQRLGHAPFLASVVHARSARLRRLGEGLRAIAVPLAIALTASVVFQQIIRARVRLVFALAYALLFVALPYFFARGMANRFLQIRHGKPRKA